MKFWGGLARFFREVALRSRLARVLAWLDTLPTWQRRGVAVTCGVLILSLIVVPFYFEKPKEAKGALTTIRQEINILDSYDYAPSGSFATSSEIAQLDPTQYNGATYYFEVVASTTSATNATVSLVDSTGATAASVTVNGTSYARYRSSSFTAPGSATEYTVRLGNESVGKGVIAARIIVLQSNNPITQTETQIEIGNNETYTSTATTSLASPKYWYYDSSKWDGSPTFYAEVTYANTVEPSIPTASTTDYQTAGTFTYNVTSGATQVVIKAWGGGGGAGTGDGTNKHGGGGGAGGQYAQSTITSPTGSHTLVVAASQSTGATNGNDSTYDSTTVVAKGGQHGSNYSGGSGAAGAGSTAGCVGTDVCYAGGNGAAGSSTGSGGGGGGAGDSGTGGNASGQSSGNATSIGGGNGGGGSTANNSGGGNGAAAGGGGGGATKSNVPGSGAAGRITLIETVPVAGTATTTIALQEDDGSFSGWTDKVYIVNNGTASSATRVRSSSFTPTSGRHYRIAMSNGYGGATFAIYNAKIVVDQATITAVDSSYPESNYSFNFSVSAGSSLDTEGQAFVSNGGTLDSAKFYLERFGSPTGNMTAKLFGTTGTCGTNAVGSGAALATSDAIDVSTVSNSAFGLITFNFSGGNRISLTNGICYAVVVEYSSGGDGSNYIAVGADTSSPTDPGNETRAKSGTWSNLAATDVLFYVYVESSSLTLLEPQYLLANTTLAAGTSLQKFLTRWDATEWGGSNNTYTYQVDSGGGSSVVEADTAAGSQLSGSSVTASSASSVSSSLTMPATGDLDMKATTNNNDVYASRILVDVTPGDTSAPTPDPPLFSDPAGLPTATTTNAIGMTAATETDAGSPPVQYYFHVNTDFCFIYAGTGGTDSGWQSSPYYSATGLDPNKCYAFYIKARDSAGIPNYTATSTTASSTFTLANVPGAPTLATSTATTAVFTNDANGNPSFQPDTEFAVQVTATSPTDSSWLGKYISANGSPTGTVTWLVNSDLQATTTQSLTPNTTYTFKSMARNFLGTVTASSSGVSVLTLPDVPTSITFSGTTDTTTTVNWTAPATGADSYKIERCTGTGCSSYAQIASGVTATNYADSGLTQSTTYRYRVRATNASGDGAYATPAEVTTNATGGGGANFIRLKAGVRLKGGVRLR